MNKKTIKVRESSKGEFYFRLEDFADIVDTNKVKYYKLTDKDNGSFMIKFYDKNKKLVKLNVSGK